MEHHYILRLTFVSGLKTILVVGGLGVADNPSVFM